MSHRKRTLARRIALAAALAVCSAAAAWAGPCEEALAAAEQRFRDARFREVVSAVEPCLDGQASWSNEVRAWVWRARAHRELHEGSRTDEAAARARGVVRSFLAGCEVPDQDCGFTREDFEWLVLSYFGLDVAKLDCQTQLREAERAYRLGRLTAVLELVRVCLTGDTLRENRVRANELRARASIARDDDAGAARAVLDLVCLDPGFAFQSSDPPEFRRLVEQQRAAVRGVPRTVGEVADYCSKPPPPPPRRCPDRDRDGFADCRVCPEPPCDCADTNDAIRPGARERCDGLDNDCDPSTPDGSGEDWYRERCDGPDADRCEEGVYTCSGGLKLCGDDTPDTPEICDNGIDDDCNGLTDGDDPACRPPDGCRDRDGDGWIDCRPPCRPQPGQRCDCDDANPCCNETCRDEDGDGCCPPDDCDDANPHCIDDCPDEDGDGYCWRKDCDDRVPSCILDCSDRDGDQVRGCDGDCDDADPRNFPGNPEVCDGQDNDCDCQCDEGCGPWDVGVLGGFFVPDGDLSNKDETFGEIEPQAGVRLGYLFGSHWGAFVDATYSDINTDFAPQDSVTITTRAGAERYFRAHQRRLAATDRDLEWRWFVAAGLGWIRFDLEFGQVVDRALVSAGFGQRWELDRRARLRWELRGDHAPAGGGFDRQDLTSVQLVLGLSWSLGERCGSRPCP